MWTEILKKRFGLEQRIEKKMKMKMKKMLLTALLAPLVDNNLQLFLLFSLYLLFQ
jgi:hypothetical protein